jgi:hypothetical protein
MYSLHFLEGMSYRRVADLLNAEDVPMPSGGLRWTKSAVVRVMYSTHGRAVGTELGLLAA